MQLRGDGLPVDMDRGSEQKREQLRAERSRNACRFSGAIKLDKLHIDGSPQLDVRQGWRTHRRLLREENEWWDKYAQWTDFTYNVFLYDGLFDNSSLQHYSERVGAQNPLIARERAHNIAEIYRALRKSREDSKDEPGAADFYYGEMEMRRKAAGSSVEGILLAAYWLLSGYGLRAWRAVTAVVVMLTFAATLFATTSIAVTRDTVYVSGPKPGTYVSAKSNAHPPTWDDAFDYTWQYATSLVRPIPDPPKLTWAGRLLEIFLRFAGPGLLALTVLALRARVKR